MSGAEREGGGLDIPLDTYLTYNIPIAHTHTHNHDHFGRSVFDDPPFQHEGTYDHDDRAKMKARV